jgi:hypothetical protein
MRPASEGWRMAPIYLSSTYHDLEPHRRAAFDQLTSMKHRVTATRAVI